MLSGWKRQRYGKPAWREGEGEKGNTTKPTFVPLLQLLLIEMRRLLQIRNLLMRQLALTLEKF